METPDGRDTGGKATVDRSRPHAPTALTVDADFTRLELIGRFLSFFRQHGNLSLACREANVGRTMIYKWARDDKEGFAADLNEALLEANERIEQEIFRRGVEGYDESVFFQGKHCGAVHKFSDLLLIFLAKARMPDKYRDKFEGANLQLGGSLSIGSLSIGARNDIISVISSLPEEELRRLADRGRSLPSDDAD